MKRMKIFKYNMIATNIGCSVNNVKSLKDKQYFNDEKLIQLVQKTVKNEKLVII